MNIIQRVKVIAQSAADKFESEFVTKFKSDFPELDSSLLEITSRSHRPVTHAVYNNEHKYVSKQGLFELFKSYNTLRKREGLEAENISMDVLIDCWKSCMSTKLLPNIIQETENWFKVEFLSPEEFHMLTTTRLSHVSKNKDKLNEYYDSIKDLPVCINDFNLCNFVYNNQTGELFLIDIGDIDYTDQFLPEMFFISTPGGQFTYYICKALQRLEEPEYKKNIQSYLGGLKEVESIQFF